MAGSRRLNRPVEIRTRPYFQASPIEKLHVLSVAPLFGEAIKSIHTGESVSARFV
jgi:phosphoribosylpyrophosphate synthetase